MASDPGTLGCKGLEGPEKLSTATKHMYGHHCPNPAHRHSALSLTLAWGAPTVGVLAFGLAFSRQKQ